MSDRRGCRKPLDSPIRWLAIVSVLLWTIVEPSRSVAPHAVVDAAGPGFSTAGVPLHFEENRGQAPSSVTFLARAAGYDTFLTATGARIALRAPVADGPRPVRALDIGFRGAAASPRAEAEAPLAGTVNYLRGRDPAAWQVGVPTFARVRYRQVYPGVDLVFYGNERELEYDFIVEPGADYRQIQVEFGGVDRLRIEQGGDLVLHVGDRHIVQRRPVVYQLAEGRRQPVEARYAALGGSRVGFAVGEYDRERPLIIDPVLVYSTYFGGTEPDSILGVATDATGHVYLAGRTASADFPVTSGAYDTTLGGRQDAYVARLNPAGTALVYATVFGGSDIEDAFDVAVNAAGEAYVTGHTHSADFPVTPGAVSAPCAGGDCGFDAFVVKLNAAGSGLVYAARLSGTLQDTGFGIALDDDGSAVVAGSTRSVDFPVSSGAFQPFKRGNQFSDDHFVTRLDASGSAIVFSTYFGGSGREDGLVRVAVDPGGHAYVAGTTQSGDFPVRNAVQPGLRGESDGFVASFGRFGDLQFSTYLGGSSFENLLAIAVDAGGAIYVTGRTNSPDFPLVMPSDATHEQTEAFVTKFAPGGASLLYSTFLGGPGQDQGRAIAVDGEGHVHVAVSADVGFPTTADGAAATDGGAFYVRLDPAAQITFSSYIGPAFPQDIALDPSGSVYVGGVTLGTDMTLRNPLQAAHGGQSGFLAKFGEWPPPASPDDIVLYATHATTVAGAWRRVADPGAAGYEVLHHPDAGAPKLASALASPAHYFDLTFTPQAGRPYRLWLRGRAQGDHWSNDSVFVQFSHSVSASGSPEYRIGTSSSTPVNLEDCVNCGLSGWGWQDNGYGAGVLGPLITFASDAPQTLRVQTREDGMMVDQIVLSPETWLSTAPGGLKNDHTVLGDRDGSGSDPEPPPPPGGDVVLHAAKAALTGNWVFADDASAASGRRAWNPNANLPKRTTALANPGDTLEMTFVAEAGRAYRLWIRGKAEGDFWGNDSVFVQFSGSVNADGAAVFRIGTTSATEYNLESCIGCGLSGWGWEDNGWGAGVLGPLIYFAASGPQTIRLQPREDGLSVDQIVLSPDRFLHAAPGAAKNDTVILPESSGGAAPPPAAQDIVLHAADATVLAGNWRLATDASAASGQRAWDPDGGAPKLTSALAAPVHYVELSFTARAGRPYRLWIRGRAERDHWSNDSVHVQFTGSVDASGAPVYRIGTTSAAEYNLESCAGCGLAGWGWEDNGWGTGVLGPLIYFAADGPQTIRLQRREDGLSFDQIILSPDRFLQTAPGQAKHDATIYPRQP